MAVRPLIQGYIRWISSTSWRQDSGWKNPTMRHVLIKSKSLFIVDGLGYGAGQGWVIRWPRSQVTGTAKRLQLGGF